MTGPPEQAGVAALRRPEFDVRISPPDLAAWIPGNIGLPGFSSFSAPRPGPHVAVIALTHGNEFAGAIVLDRLLGQGLRPLRGTLTLGFANLAAFARFDPGQPTASRFIDEDLNRVWDRDVLDGPRETSELLRARAMRPLIDSVDALLDLHSMLWPSDPLMLCGSSAKGLDLAERIAAPDLVVADHGHVSGRRLIDYGRFSDAHTGPVANLIEAGRHWLPETISMTEQVTWSFLQQTGVVPRAQDGIRDAAVGGRRVAEVTHVVTAGSAAFTFVSAFRGGDVIARRNTLIALDGTVEIRTPYDDCLLVMPSLRPSRGHTAVRLARLRPFRSG